VLSCALMGAASGCNGGHDRRELAEFDEFVPAQMAPSTSRGISLHPEYMKDEAFRQGLATVLARYGHEFVFLKDTVLTRKSMFEEAFGEEAPSPDDELDWRANMTSHAFGAAPRPPQINGKPD